MDTRDGIAWDGVTWIYEGTGTHLDVIRVSFCYLIPLAPLARKHV
jgi:hypothetical protein